MSLSVYANNKLKKNDDNDGWTKLYDLIPSKKKVLDIGCSSGNFGAELIKKKKCTVVGIDINETDIELAKKHLNAAYILNIEQDSVEELGKFDVIIMADVIEHLLDPSSALKKLKSLLNEGGILVFSVPNMANMSVRLELLHGRFEYTEYGLLDETHVHYFDRIELEKRLNAAGFYVEKYNCTVRDIPREFIMKQLKSSGLIPNDSFWKIAESEDSRTFQFIGVAKPSAGKHNAQVESKTPYDFVSRQMDALKENYEQQLLDASSGKSSKISKKSQEYKLAEVQRSLNDRGNAILHLEGLNAQKDEKIAELQKNIDSLKARNIVKRIRNK